MHADRKIQSACRAEAAAADKPRQRRRGPFDPRQTNLMLPIRGDRSRADGPAPAADSAAGAPPRPARAGAHSPIDSAAYRAVLAEALRGEDDATIAEWARGCPRAAKNWRHALNGADAPALINLAKRGRSARVRAWLLAELDAVEPQHKRKAG